jgi:hypothetical protein
MHTTLKKSRTHCQVNEPARLRELQGLPLATFSQRLLGYAIDLMIAVSIWAPLEACWRI